MPTRRFLRCSLLKQKEIFLLGPKRLLFLKQIRHQIDLEMYENVSGGLLNDSIVENLENIANSAHNWAVKIRVKSQDGAMFAQF